MPVGVGIAAEVGHDRRVVAAQVDGASGAGGVGLGGEVLRVVVQVGEQQPDARAFVGDPVAVGGQLGDQLLAGGFVGAFLRGRACPPASSPSGGGPGTPALAGLRQPTDQTTII